jgi:putative ABC transport system substrate-binding protein
MFCGANLEAMFRRSAYCVDRILKSAYLGSLPIEQPRDFAFVINLKTAAGLGLTVPSLVRLQTTEFIR